MNHGLAVTHAPAALIACLRASAERARLWRPISLSKGRSIDWHGADATRLIIVERGLVKLSYLSSSGEERIKSFIADQGLFSGVDEVAEHPFEAICLEPSSIVSLPMPWVRSATQEDPAIERAVGEFWSWLSARKRARENALLCLSASQRYLAFQAEAPTLLGRLSQGDIARYLGITPIAFSRIKRRLRSPSLDPAPVEG
jgi:CRP-like cAMP-binding protein